VALNIFTFTQVFDGGIKWPFAVLNISTL